jgi:predicted anti-sigma-YlaC factor YlaD
MSGIGLGLVVLILLGGCSVRTLAINALADSLAESSDVYAADEDPKLVKDALPFALKTIESLLAERPDHRVLLLAACRGFAQYSYAFVETEAEKLEDVDFEASEKQFQRALDLYIRARDYCLRSMELDHAGVTDGLISESATALDSFGHEDVPLLFWTGASWGGAINVGQAQPEIVADLPAVRALMKRALALDESYDLGSIHTVMISLEALPETMGGSPEQARYHFERAVELSSGLNAGPYVALAESISVADQNWEEFQELLEAALAIDPDRAPSIRLVNIVTQDLFFDYPSED